MSFWWGHLSLAASRICPLQKIPRSDDYEVVSRISIGIGRNDFAALSFPVRIGYWLFGGRILAIHCGIDSKSGDERFTCNLWISPRTLLAIPYGEPRSGHSIIFEHQERAPIRRINAQGVIVPAEIPTPVRGKVLKLRDDL